MIITKRNYDEKTATLSDLNVSLSEQFLEMIERLQISNLNIASVGNSISAGYSKCDKILPFLMRSNIYKLSKDINYFSYARVRRNEDINILRWYNSNISHQEINDLNIDDIAVKQHAYVDKHWDTETLKNYDEISSKNNIGFRQFNLLNNSIIIYNGFTGEFTNTLRKGTSADKLKILTAFKKDMENAKLILTQMYLDNPNTQVYVCGLPNIMGTGIISFLDKYIKEICKQIPNTIYLPGTTRNSLFYLDGQKEFDIHYSQPEYLDLWNNITGAIVNNFVPKIFITSLLQRLREYSILMEKESTISKGSEEDIFRIIKEEVEKHIPLFIRNNQTMDSSIEEIIRYYNRNYLSTFPCTPREKVLTKLLQVKQDYIIEKVPNVPHIIKSH